jgi:hypothetical protein
MGWLNKIGFKLQLIYQMTVLLALAACGSMESVSVRFALQPIGVPDRQLLDINEILEEFNQRSGSNIAYLCSQDCTGTIEFIGRRSDAVVGLCEPSTYVRSKSRFSMKTGLTQERKSELRADIKLSSDLMAEGNRDFLRTIIFHELGHGLLLEHSPSEQDVMFAVVNGEKNFDSYFEQVRQKLLQLHL